MLYTNINIIIIIIILLLIIIVITLVILNYVNKMWLDNNNNKYEKLHHFILGFFHCFFIKGQPKFWSSGNIDLPSCPYSLPVYSGRLVARFTSVKKAIWTWSRHSMPFLIAARIRVNPNDAGVLEPLVVAGKNFLNSLFLRSKLDHAHPRSCHKRSAKNQTVWTPPPPHPNSPKTV